jgi:signal transduction histidine kinase
MIIYGLVSLFEELKGATGFYREQIKYVIWGSVIGFVGGSTNFPLMMGFSWFPPLGSPLVIAYPVLFGYAMVRHRLMDIKFILRQSSVYLLSLLTVLAVVLGARIVYGRFLPASVKWLDLVILVLALYVFPYIRDYYYRIANKYFFSSLYDSRELIAKLSDGLRSTLDVNQIYNLISSTLISALHIKAFGVLNYNEASGQYLVQFNSGFNVGERKVFPGDRVLHEQFIKKSKSIVVEELKATSYKEHKEIIDLLSGVSAAVVVPLNIKDETLGVMVLGQKESADMYNDEDLRTLEIISSQAAIAIKNAQLYDETKEFSLTLQREVERQTAQLKQANIELQRLDRAKSDFISIASHQLRTPLTTIKGFTSMILEGTYGRISAKLRDKVEKVFESSERLIRLVNDLLDLSHMEGGKMEFNFAKVDFDKMVESVVEELKPQAQKKKLKLQISLPHRELWVWADEQKLRQVVMNLVDNAIKYTEKGEVGVLLKEKNSFTQLAVRDSGIGMKPQDVERLFQKFVRGIEAPRYYTEGAGIGLYVAKQLIEAQKGRIWAESAGEDQGSTFYIKMPNYRQRVSKSVN